MNLWLPSQLPEATALDPDADWAIVQSAGEQVVRKVRPALFDQAGGVDAIALETYDTNLLGGSMAPLSTDDGSPTVAASLTVTLTATRHLLVMAGLNAQVDLQYSSQSAVNARILAQLTQQKGSAAKSVVSGPSNVCGLVRWPFTVNGSVKDAATAIAFGNVTLARVLRSQTTGIYTFRLECIRTPQADTTSVVNNRFLGVWAL